MSWTLQDIPISEQACKSALLATRCQAIDTLTLRFNKRLGESSITAGTWCQLKEDGVIKFAGEAILPGGSAEDGRHEGDIVINGPWADLDSIAWRTGAGSTTSVRLRFPEDPESTDPVFLAVAVSSVLAHAVFRGARFQIGSINLSGQIASLEFDGQFLSEILRTLLRYSPGAAVWFDYSTLPLPTIHVVKATSLPSLNLTAAGRTGTRVQQRTDFRVAGVQLVYRKQIVTNYGTSEGVQTDDAGSVNSLRTLIVPLDLAPARAQYDLQRVRIEVALADYTLEAWWRKWMPPDFQELPGTLVETSATGDNTLTHYPTGGQMVSWMLSEIDGVANTEPFGCTGPLSVRPGAAPNPAAAWSLDAPALHIANSQSFKRATRKFSAKFNFGTEEFPYYQAFSIDLPCTNCTDSGAYYRETLVSWDSGEPLPTGLAAEVYSQCLRLAFSGAIGELNGDSAIYRPGRCVNITDKDPDWAAMNSPIQTAEHDLLKRLTKITFGPALRLGPADLLELARMKNRKPPERAKAEEEEPLEPLTYSLTVATATETSDGTSGEPEEETGTVNITIVRPSTSDLDVSAFGWTIGGKSGSGHGEEQLPPGTYTIVWLPVLGYKTPLPEEVVVVADETSFPTGTWEYADKIYLQNGSDPTVWALLDVSTGDPYFYLNAADGSRLELTTADIKLYDPEGRGVYVNKTGWIQQKGGTSGDKEIYLDPTDIPADSVVKGLTATSNFANIADTEPCGSGGS